VLFTPPGWWQIKLEDYQRQRLLVYFDANFAAPNATAEEQAKGRRLQFEKSYQVRQALISVGSGGISGKGWHQGNQTALGFLPPGAAHNDFIFSVIAEEEGFVGSLVVLTLYSVVLFTGIRIAGQARDRLGKLMAVGVVTLLFSHVFINIGMNIRIVPVTGIPLPLLSYGGSSVLGSLIAMGMLQNVYIYRKAY
jgi:rod shape determining protein RodA